MKILKLIIAGAVAGAALFFMPFFILKTLIIFLIIAGLFRLFAGRRFGSRGFGRDYRFAFADKIRSMSEEEYSSFKQNSNKSCGDRQKNNNKENNDQQ